MNCLLFDNFILSLQRKKLNNPIINNLKLLNYDFW